VWGLLGLLLGILLMLMKTPPIAESGRKPDDVFFYSFWVPMGSIAGAVFGAALGFLFSCLMEWNRARLGEGAMSDDISRKFLPRLVCGGIAGGILGVGLGSSEATFFLLLVVGVCSGVVSTVLVRAQRNRGGTQRGSAAS